jgi:transposase
MYSNDLINKVTLYYTNNFTTYKETSKIFNISISSIRRWLNGIVPLGIRKKKIDEHKNIVNIIIEENPLVTHYEIKNKLNNKISIGSINTIIKQLKFSYKKVTHKVFYKDIKIKKEKQLTFIKNYNFY